MQGKSLGPAEERRDVLKVTIKGEPHVCGWKKIEETEGVDRKRSKKVIVIVKTCPSLHNASIIPSFFFFFLICVF